MLRTKKEDRKANASMFAQACKNLTCNLVAIHVRRNEGNRCQFIYFPSAMSGGIVIAESTGLGVEGCWIELISFLRGGIVQKTFHEDGFYDWLRVAAGLDCVYHDPEVFVFKT